MKIKHVLSAVSLALLAFGASAQTAEEVGASLKKQYPGTTFREVRPSEIPGIFEVVMGRNIAYTDKSGRYFLFGHLYDMKEQTDLTASRTAETRKVEFPAKHLANALKTVKGDGSRQLAVFSDPDCPYCKDLEAQLLQLDNVTVYTFLMPLESLHPQAKTKAISVWCSGDRNKVWTDWMLSRVMPPMQSCNNPINENIALGGSLGVVGTPTLIAADGRTLPGSAPAAKIDQWLNGGGQ